MSPKGKFFGVGVGPGDTELLTLKAARLLQEIKTIAYPMPNGAESLARRIVAPLIPESAREMPIDLPIEKSGRGVAAAYDHAAHRIATCLLRGEDVIYLCEGDPLFYGSFMYLLARLAPHHETSIVPGVTSISACAAVLGRPFASRGQVLKIIPGILAEERLRTELRAVEAAAIIKVGNSFGMVRKVLREMSLSSRAFVIEHATQAGQRVVSLDEITEDRLPYFSTIMLCGESEAAS